MDVQDVFTADIVGHLANRFEKRQTFDVADRTADLHDGHVHSLGNPHDALLDLVGNVRHNLDGPAEIVATPLLRDDGIVDTAGRVVIFVNVSEVYRS